MVYVLTRLFYQAPATVPKCVFAYGIRLKNTFFYAIITKQERQRKIGVRAQAFRETPIFSFARCLKLCFFYMPIRKNDNENIISEWLAFLFDINKCSSPQPLKLFCEFWGIEFDDSQLEIGREYTTEVGDVRFTV